MTTIRPFVAADSEDVARLYERVVRSGSPDPPRGLGAYFRRTFLEHPWTDPEIPSLVAEDGAGQVVGFIGSHARRFRFDGDPIRLACSGQLTTAPEARHHAVGAFLLGRYMRGPQDVTITDGANEPARQLWKRLGGEALHLGCIDWIRILRPAATARQYRGTRRKEAVWRLAAPAVAAIDAAATRLSRRLRVSARPTLGEELTAERLVESLPTLAGSLRLHPDYDLPFATWLFREMAAVRSRGRLVRTLVRDESGRTLGWYVAYVPPGGVAEAVQIAAADRDTGAVLDHLLFEAASLGAASVRGRLEPRLLPALRGRRCLLRYNGNALVYSPRVELAAAVRGARALLTRMDGEWWMGHHIEPFD
jgi:hypothetical protein